MKVAAAVFRFRAVVFVLLYLLGFFPPWGWGARNGSNGTLWLASSTLLARSGWISLAAATVMVTAAALACLLTGTVLRVWSTAYLGRSVRNPLYLGAWLLACGASILMPPGGAGFFLIALGIFVLFLAYSEKRFLPVKLGARPEWAQAAFAETYPIAFTVCFAIFAWRYNARVLIQCLLICYGLSLVARAFMTRSAN
jgi:protein-S-isoprenylcysteine O-methyltransferase Ste14